MDSDSGERPLVQRIDSPAAEMVLSKSTFTKNPTFQSLGKEPYLDGKFAGLHDADLTATGRSTPSTTNTCSQGGFLRWLLSK